jgi:hypothetical protein
MPAIVLTLYLLAILLIICLAIKRVLFPPKCPTTRVHLHFRKHKMAFNPGAAQLLTAVPANGDGILTSAQFTVSDAGIASLTPTADPFVVRVDFLAVGHVDFDFTAVNSVGDPVTNTIGADVVPVADPVTAVTLSFSDVV